MFKLTVYKPNNVEQAVLLMKHKISGEYSFINLTKQHICPCRFSSLEEAMKDLDSYVSKGKILKYTKPVKITGKILVLQDLS